MIIVLDDSGTPLADQIQNQIRGLIETGALGRDQRLPSVRQLAGDLGVAPGTVAKAYRALEADGTLVTRIGSGTRVGSEAAATPGSIIDAAAQLATAGRREGVTIDEAIRVLRALWPN